MVSPTFPHPSSPAPPTALVEAPPALEQVATAVHRAAGVDPCSRLVYVEHHAGRQGTSLGFWDLAPDALHPVEALVGFVAPPRWSALGLVSSGRARSLDPSRLAAPPAERTVVTVLLGRDGSVVSILEQADGRHHVQAEAPVGLVPDALARALVLPTPPPAHTVGHLVNLRWLDRIAAGLLHRPSCGRSWRWMADRHPLRGSGAPPSAEELAARVAWCAQEWSWAKALATMSSEERPTGHLNPPGGTIVTAAEWFDEGSVSRWMLRNLPPAEALLPDLLAVLPPSLGEQLLVALGDP